MPDQPAQKAARRRGAVSVSGETPGRRPCRPARDYPRSYKRLHLALSCREWPWRIPREVVELVGMRRPPEHVFDFFRRLHGLD